jgi:hypothetical protein
MGPYETARWIRLLAPPFPGADGLMGAVGRFTWAWLRWAVVIGLGAWATWGLPQYAGVTLPDGAARQIAFPASLLVVWVGAALAYCAVDAERREKAALLQPRIMIEHDPMQLACAQDDVGHAIVGGRRYILRTRRIRVTLVGNQSAKNLKVVLDDVQPGGAHAKPLRERNDEPGMYNPFTLSFSANPGEPLYFDVAQRADDGIEGHAPPGHFLWRYADHDFPNTQPDNMYEITILATADGVPAKRERFRLVSGPNWLTITPLPGR